MSDTQPPIAQEASSASPDPVVPENAKKTTKPPPAALNLVPNSNAEPTVPNEDTVLDFNGDLDTNNDIPTLEDLHRVEDMTVLDKYGKAIQFKSLYSGTNVTRRVLVIFIRHFFCGNCQEYIRTLTKSISPDELLALSIPTFIAIVGHGPHKLIDMYITETGCTFPIYADSNKGLYKELGMLRTLDPGSRPDYQRRGTALGMWQSIRQGMSGFGKMKAIVRQDWYQVGGEFLFEPINIATPIHSPALEPVRQLNGVVQGSGATDSHIEEKHITWCHRMRNTRDHAELPELREILGLDGDGVPGKDKRRWEKAVEARKGSGQSAVAASNKSMPGTGSTRQSISEANGNAAKDSSHP